MTDPSSSVSSPSYWLIAYARKNNLFFQLDPGWSAGNMAWEGSLAEWIGEFQSDGYTLLSATKLSGQEYLDVSEVITE